MKNTRFYATKRLVFLALLSAQAVVLAWIENLLPPLPFMPPGGKAGLSNIVTMYAVDTVGLSGAMGVAVVKSLFVFVTRGVTAGLLSLCGGVVSVAVMFAAYRQRSPFGYLGIGVLGAAAHQCAQAFVSWLLIGRAILMYLPFLLLTAIVTGCITGVVLYLILPVMNKLTQGLFYERGGVPDQRPSQ